MKKSEKGFSIYVCFSISFITLLFLGFGFPSLFPASLVSPSNPIEFSTNLNNTNVIKGTYPIKINSTTYYPLANISLYVNGSLDGVISSSNTSSVYNETHFISYYDVERGTLTNTNITNFNHQDNLYSTITHSNNVRFNTHFSYNSFPFSIPCYFLFDFYLSQRSNYLFQIYNYNSHSYETLISGSNGLNTEVNLSLGVIFNNNINNYLEPTMRYIRIHTDIQAFGSPHSTYIRFDRINLLSLVNQTQVYENSYTYLLNTLAYSNGLKNVTIIIKDINNNIKAQTFLVYFDNENPVIQSFNIIQQGNELHFSGSVSDNLNLTNVYLQYYDEYGNLSQYYLLLPHQMKQNLLFDFTKLLKNGTYYFTLFAIDNATNIQSQSMSFSLFFQFNQSIIYQNNTGYYSYNYPSSLLLNSIGLIELNITGSNLQIDLYNQSWNLINSYYSGYNSYQFNASIVQNLIYYLRIYQNSILIDQKTLNITIIGNQTILKTNSIIINYPSILSVNQTGFINCNSIGSNITFIMNNSLNESGNYSNNASILINSSIIQNISYQIESFYNNQSFSNNSLMISIISYQNNTEIINNTYYIYPISQISYPSIILANESKNITFFAFMENLSYQIECNTINLNLTLYNNASLLVNSSMVRNLTYHITTYFNNQSIFIQDLLIQIIQIENLTQIINNTIYLPSLEYEIYYPSIVKQNDINSIQINIFDNLTNIELMNGTLLLGNYTNGNNSYTLNSSILGYQNFTLNIFWNNTFQKTMNLSILIIAIPPLIEIIYPSIIKVNESASLQFLNYGNAIDFIVNCSNNENFTFSGNQSLNINSSHPANLTYRIQGLFNSNLIFNQTLNISIIQLNNEIIYINNTEYINTTIISLIQISYPSIVLINESKSISFLTYIENISYQIECNDINLNITLYGNASLLVNSSMVRNLTYHITTYFNNLTYSIQDILIPIVSNQTIYVNQTEYLFFSYNINYPSIVKLHDFQYIQTNISSESINILFYKNSTLIGNFTKGDNILSINASKVDIQTYLAKIYFNGTLNQTFIFSIEIYDLQQNLTDLFSFSYSASNILFSGSLVKFNISIYSPEITIRLFDEKNHLLNTFKYGNQTYELRLIDVGKEVYRFRVYYKEININNITLIFDVQAEKQESSLINSLAKISGTIGISVFLLGLIYIGYKYYRNRLDFDNEPQIVI